MEWILLIIAILFEVSGTTLFKFADGFRNLFALLGGLVLFAVSLTIWSLSLSKIDVSVAYAIWSGVGTTLIVCIGYFWFGEVMTPPKLLFIVMTVVGAIGLNLTSRAP